MQKKRSLFQSCARCGGAIDSPLTSEDLLTEKPRSLPVCGGSAGTDALRELVRDSRGVAAVQFLFLLLPLLLLLLGTLDVGLAMLTANRINFTDEAQGRAEMEAIWHPEGVWAGFLARRQDR